MANVGGVSVGTLCLPDAPKSNEWSAIVLRLSNNGGPYGPRLHQAELMLGCLMLGFTGSPANETKKVTQKQFSTNITCDKCNNENRNISSNSYLNKVVAVAYRCIVQAYIQREIDVTEDCPKKNSMIP
jgi:hypothetical protein